MYEANLFEQNRKYFFLIFKRTENDYETLYLPVWTTHKEMQVTSFIQIDLNLYIAAWLWINELTN